MLLLHFACVCCLISFHTAIAWSVAPIRILPPQVQEIDAKEPHSKLRQLQLERLKALESVVENKLERVKIGRDPLSSLFDVYGKLLDAKLDVADGQEAKLKACRDVHKDVLKIEEIYKTSVESGIRSSHEYFEVKGFRLEIEIKIEKLQSSK